MRSKRERNHFFVKCSSSFSSADSAKLGTKNERGQRMYHPNTWIRSRHDSHPVRASHAPAPPPSLQLLSIPLPALGGRALLVRKPDKSNHGGSKFRGTSATFSLESAEPHSAVRCAVAARSLRGLSTLPWLPSCSHSRAFPFLLVPKQSTFPLPFSFHLLSPLPCKVGGRWRAIRRERC